MRLNKKGFTLVELIVVIIIIGVLAAIAAPMMNAMKTKAILSEGITGMGAIRSAIRIYRSTGGTANYAGWLTDTNFPAWASNNLGIGPKDLEGTYFSQGAYWLTMSGSSSNNGVYVVIDMGRNIAAPKGAETKTIGGYGSSLFMDMNGNITQFDIPASGYPTYSGGLPEYLG
ncbi:MAG: prepilin-type N-terminal cleavage/methylation domain-containing protein [Candidatus Omnitrophica bacterium]|nr:prepilin-type N-terminal cleavage/methylation domain-containing protein [Candidatus Omnitrophota bacterium]